MSHPPQRRPGSKPERKPPDPAAEFEQLLREADPAPRYSLRLYVTGSTARSIHALANIRALCDEYLPGRYELEVIDIYQQPSAAMREQIVAAPTLVKRLPTPRKLLIGDLSDKARVLSGLNLPPTKPPGEASA